MSNTILYLDVTIDNQNVDEEIFPILKRLRPTWTKDDLCKESFSKGLLNCMVCYYQKSDPNRNDAMVVRVHGLSDAGLNDRDQEFVCLQAAQAAACFPAIYVTFNNGMIYKYSQGRMMTYKDFLDPEIIREITRKLYQFHHVDVDSLSLLNRKGEPTTLPKTDDGFAYLQIFLDKIPEKENDPGKDTEFQKLRRVLTNEVLQKYLDEVKNIFKEIDSPICLSHGDFHPFNMIYNEANKSVTFIDYELTVYKYETRDLAGLFMFKPYLDLIGMVPKDDPDVTDEARLLWIRSYLEAMYAATGKKADEIPEAHLELLDVEHRVMQIAYLLELVIFSLSFVNLGIRADVYGVIQLALDTYYSMKDELPGLRKKYQEVKARLSNNNT